MSLQLRMTHRARAQISTIKGSQPPLAELLFSVCCQHSAAMFRKLKEKLKQSPARSPARKKQPEDVPPPGDDGATAATPQAGTAAAGGPQEKSKAFITEPTTSRTSFTSEDSFVLVEPAVEKPEQEAADVSGKHDAQPQPKEHSQQVSESATGAPTPPAPPPSPLTVHYGNVDDEDYMYIDCVSYGLSAAQHDRERGGVAPTFARRGGLFGAFRGGKVFRHKPKKKTASVPPLSTSTSLSVVAQRRSTRGGRSAVTVKDIFLSGSAPAPARRHGSFKGGYFRSSRTRGGKVRESATEFRQRQHDSKTRGVTRGMPTSRGVTAKRAAPPAATTASYRPPTSAAMTDTQIIRRLRMIAPATCGGLSNEEIRRRLSMSLPSTATASETSFESLSRPAIISAPPARLAITGSAKGKELVLKIPPSSSVESSSSDMICRRQPSTVSRVGFRGSRLSITTRRFTRSGPPALLSSRHLGSQGRRDSDSSSRSRDDDATDHSSVEDLGTGPEGGNTRSRAGSGSTSQRELTIPSIVDMVSSSGLPEDAPESTRRGFSGKRGVPASARGAASARAASSTSRGASSSTGRGGPISARSGGGSDTRLALTKRPSGEREANVQYLTLGRDISAGESGTALASGGRSMEAAADRGAASHQTALARRRGQRPLGIPECGMVDVERGAFTIAALGLEGARQRENRVSEMLLQSYEELSVGLMVPFQRAGSEEMQSFSQAKEELELSAVPDRARRNVLALKHSERAPVKICEDRGDDKEKPGEQRVLWRRERGVLTLSGCPQVS